MLLSDGIIGKTYEILRFETLPLHLERRLESLGMTPGTALDVLNNKSHGTVIVRVRESRYAVGASITSHILVKEVPGPTIAQVPTIKPADTLAAKPSDKPTDRSAVKPSDKPNDRTAVKPADKPVTSSSLKFSHPAHSTSAVLDLSVSKEQLGRTEHPALRGLGDSFNRAGERARSE